MRYTKIKENDVVNGEGVCVSVWTQGCPHHCKGCFNISTWDYNGGHKWKPEDKERVLKLLDKNGVYRHLSILGGEPLCPENIHGVIELCEYIKLFRPDTKIYVWTGYLFEKLISEYGRFIFKDIDVIIDGKFEEDKKDIRLKMRGSSNQRIIDVKESLKCKKIVEKTK